jgi:hypothetical protein
MSALLLKKFIYALGLHRRGVLALGVLVQMLVRLAQVLT